MPPAQKLLRQVFFCYAIVFVLTLLFPNYLFVVAVEFPLAALFWLAISGPLLLASFRIARYTLLGSR